MVFRKTWVYWSLCFFGLCVACTRPKDMTALPMVAVTLPPIAGLVTSLVQDGACRVDVRLVGMASGGHTMEMKPHDVGIIRDASLVLLMGFRWDDGLETHTNPKAVTLRMDRVLEAKVQDDPHFWLDPRQAFRVATALVSVMQQQFPKECREAILRKNLSVLERDIETLSRKLPSKLKHLSGKRAIATHDAFVHWVRYLRDIGIVVRYEPYEMHVATAKHITSVMKAVSQSHDVIVWDVPPFAWCHKHLNKASGICFRVDPEGEFSYAVALKGYIPFLESMIFAMERSTHP